MSEQKYVILSAIKNLTPESIYKLSKMVGRDFANVKKDCDALESSGFIIMESKHDRRKTRTPRLAFDYDKIEIHLPQMVYGHLLGKEAA